MDIEAAKKFIIDQIRKSNDSALIGIMKNLVLYGMVTEGRISVEQYNKELDEAIEQAGRGEVYTTDEVKRMLKAT